MELTIGDFMKKIIFTFLLLSQTIFAMDQITLCDYCSDQRMTDKALASIDNGFVIVVNRPSSIINRYYVLREHEPGQSIASAYLTNIDPNDEDKISRVVQAYNALRALKAVNASELPLDVEYQGWGALDFAGNGDMSALENAVTSYVSRSTFGHLTSVSNLVIQSILHNLQNTITIKFDDGSSFKFILVRFETDIDGNGQVTSRYRVLSETGKDEIGKPIPRNRNGFSGITRTGSRDYLNDWIEAARRYGIQIGPAQQGPKLKYICFWNDNRLTCQIVRVRP